MRSCDGMRAIERPGRDTEECPGCPACEPAPTPVERQTIAYAPRIGWLRRDGMWTTTGGALVRRATPAELAEYGLTGASAPTARRAA